jgi:hypothetical protein
VCFKVVNHEPLPITSFDPKLPPEIDRIVSRAIAKDAGQRYQTGMELARDIRQLRESYELTQQARRSAGSTLEPTNMLIADGAVAAGSGSWSTWKGVLLTALFAIVIGFISSSVVHTTHQQPGRATKLEPVVERDTASVGNNNRDSKSNWSGNSVPDVPTNATLQIEIHHHFASARASVWLDNRVIYTHSLRGDIKTRALVFRQVEGRQVETIGVPVGKHKVKVRIQSPADHYDQSKTIADAFMRNGQSTLQIVCGKKRDILQLKLQ